MKILENQSLKSYNTFGIEATAKLFVDIRTEEDLQALLNSGLMQKESYLVIGGGSNLLFVNSFFDGLIVKMSTMGKKIVKETDDEVWLRVQAGEVWGDFVNYCLNKNWGGLENLSAVPGSVGACPVQNMGAYGTESKDCIEEVEAVEIATGKKRIFSNAECKFAYRQSIFKNELKNQYIVTSVVFRLSKKSRLHISYKGIQCKLDEMNLKNPTIQDVGKIVEIIRLEKLPLPRIIGNAGSFFKNPIVSQAEFERLKNKYPDIVYFQDEKGVKLSAGWLIEQAGWKGKRQGDAGVYEKQALILVNHGNATGQEIWDLAQAILKSVKEKYGIELECEANILL